MSFSIEKYKTKPYTHQLKCLSEFGAKEAWALLAEMGTGKTWIVINNIAELWSAEELNGALVFAPNGVHTNWTNIELPKHMPDWVRWRSAAWKATPKKKDKVAIDSMLSSSDSSELRVFVMNWESLQTEKGMEAAVKFCLSCSKLMIVGDESSMIKNPAAARVKALMKLKKYSKYRRIMNGTPVSNGPFDLFSQFSFLDETILGTTSYYAFKAEYAEMLQEGNPLLDSIMSKSNCRGTPQVVAVNRDGTKRYKNLEKLESLIAPHSFRVLKSECLDLPKKIYKTIFYSMTTNQQKAYDLMKEESRMMLLDEEVPVQNKLVALGKLAQISSGYYLPPGSSEPVRIEGGSPKIDLLAEAVERVCKEQGKKIIIWARYHVEIDDIADAVNKLGLKAIKYDGRQKDTIREQAILDFQAGLVDVFIGQQQSGGVGITLTAASVVAYFSNTFSLYYRLQSEDRAHRIGQEEEVLYLDFVAENSIEHKTLEALRSKKKIADIITGDEAAAFLS